MKINHICLVSSYSLTLFHLPLLFSCRLVTFYFVHKFSGTKTSSSDKGQDPLTKQRLSLEVEKEAATSIDKYGSYLDIYKCLILAGKLHSKKLVDKLVNVAKYDSRHKEAVKSLKKAKVLLFYEPVSQSSHETSNATLICSYHYITLSYRTCCLHCSNFYQQLVQIEKPVTLTTLHCWYRLILTYNRGVYKKHPIQKVPMTSI